MTAEQLPRVWVGAPIEQGHYQWYKGCWSEMYVLYDGDIFTVSENEPILSPAEMSELKTCKEIDWNG